MRRVPVKNHMRRPSFRAQARVEAFAPHRSATPASTFLSRTGASRSGKGLKGGLIHQAFLSRTGASRSVP